MSSLRQQYGTSTFGADACHPLQVWTLMCPLGVGRKVAETMPMAQHSLPVDQVCLAEEHGKFPLPYTEIFPGCALHCMKDLAFTNLKRVMCWMVPPRVRW